MATTFTAAEVAEVTALAERARAADGVAPFSDDLFPAVRAGTTVAALTVRGPGGGDGDGDLAGSGSAGSGPAGGSPAHSSPAGGSAATHGGSASGDLTVPDATGSGPADSASAGGSPARSGPAGGSAATHGGSAGDDLTVPDATGSGPADSASAGGPARSGPAGGSAAAHGGAAGDDLTVPGAAGSGLAHSTSAGGRPAHSGSAHSGSAGGGVAGAAYAAAQGDRLAAELVVDPARRGQGLGGRLLAELLAAVPGELWIWSHGDHPAAAALARRHGLVRARELLQLRRRIAPGQFAEPTLPDGVRLRPFQPGRDEAAWLEVNNAAFAWHPEQGGQTLDDIRSAESAADFDPAGFILAVDADDRLLGFHWTKVHEHDPNPGPATDTADEPIGEVYVLGVAPSAHGRGLGGALTIAGLRHLADVAGVRTVTLYVEGDNTAAVRLYEREGFTRHAVDVAYRRD